ncbi:MAG: UvrD-helicase domain-containing protein, partial [Raoultibacter sp.]
MGAVRYTDEQRLCIEQLTGPVDISAGAGSGKTFTLSQRIAYALSPESGSGIDDIDAVLAITFTDKAASEIKSRVRSTLRSRGLFDAALKVDSAWISTIHGMCSRILRSHALELGLDPEFSVIDDKDRRELLDAALNEVIGSDSEIISRTEFDALFEAFPARSVGFGGSSVMGMVEELIAKAAGMVDGFAGFRMAPPASPTSALAKRLLLAYEEMVIAYEGA